MISFLEGLEKWRTRLSVAISFRYSSPPSKQISTPIPETVANTLNEPSAIILSPSSRTLNIDKDSPSQTMELTFQIMLPPPYITFLASDLEVPDLDPSKQNDRLPSYKEHRRSPRCEEDIFHPAPSYRSHFVGSRPSGADQLANWLVARTTSKGRKSKSETSERRSATSRGMANAAVGPVGRGSVQRRRTGSGLRLG